LNKMLADSSKRLSISKGKLLQQKFARGLKER
jgi:hypothetical protein